MIDEERINRMPPIIRGARARQYVRSLSDIVNTIPDTCRDYENTITELEDVIHDLSRALASKDAEIEELQEELGLNEDTISALRGDIEDETATFDILSDQFDRLEEDHERLLDRIEELNLQIRQGD